jgi:hypothetical protein
LETFAAGLAQDGAAVRAALTMSWSNAQAEGQISRLRMLKRTIYGRNSFALRRRMLIKALQDPADLISLKRSINIGMIGLRTSLIHRRSSPSLGGFR